MLFYYRSVFFNQTLYQRYLMFLKAMIEDLNDFRFNIILCLMSILDNMNMNRFMIIRIELEDKSKYYKYSWHNQLQS